MKNYVAWMDKQSKLVKVIFALPVINLLWAIYRIFKSVSEKNVLGIVLGILLLIFGFVIIWILDIITLILYNKVLWV